MTTRGVVYVHAAPSALGPHVEWAVAGILGMRVRLEWTRQPAAPGMLRAELSWEAMPGSAAALTSALRRWSMLRFEVTEEPSPGHEGERYSFTPGLGLFHATTGVHGDILVPEERLRGALGRCGTDGAALSACVRELLGTAWDEELEPYRLAGEGATVHWLHQVV